MDFGPGHEKTVRALDRQLVRAKIQIRFVVVLRDDAPCVVGLYRGIRCERNVCDKRAVDPSHQRRYTSISAFSLPVQDIFSRLSAMRR